MHGKLTVLDILQKSEMPLTLKQIIGLLGTQIPERTLRRYLKTLESEQYVMVLGGNRNRSYQAVKKTENYSTIFSSTNLKILEKLSVPLYQREPCTFQHNWIQQYIPNETFYLSAQQRQKLYDHGHQNKENQAAGTYAHKIYQRLLIDLSYNSSRLEGNTYSLVETQRLLLEGLSVEDKLDSEKIMILNHKEAIRYLVENASNIQISAENIRTIHYLLADGLVQPHEAGQVRKDGVKISGSVYIPIENPVIILELLEVICHKADQIIDPYEQSIFLLINLSYLQAFLDVNKRTARIACNIPFIKNNLVPISFNEINVEDYRSAMIAIYEFNQVNPLVELYVWSYLRTAKEYKVTMESLGFDPVRVKYRAQRRKLLHDIITNMVNLRIEDAIFAYAETNIQAKDQKKFIEDMHTDLKNLDTINIAGLGVTKDEFLNWQKSKP